MATRMGKACGRNNSRARAWRLAALGSAVALVPLARAGQTAIPAANTTALRGVGNVVPTVSIGGSSGIRTFLNSTGSSLLHPIPSNSITLGPAGSEITYTIPIDASVTSSASLQFAPNKFTTPDVVSGYLQTHSALRLEFHEQGSVGGLLALADSRIDDSLMGNTRYNTTAANATYVNHNVFGGQHVLGFPPADQFGTPVPGTANDFYLGVHASDTSWNPQAQDRVQATITEGNVVQALARGTASQAAWSRKPGEDGYGQGNPALSEHPVGTPGSRQRLLDESILNMPQDKIDPDTGAHFAAGPWNTAGAGNLNVTTFAASAITMSANPGTGLTRLNRSDSRWLMATGRLANGADFNVATQDVSSGVRNSAALMVGLDASFAVGENDDGNGYSLDAGTDQSIIGPGMRFSNHVSEGSQQKLVIARSRMAVGALDLTDCAKNARPNNPPPNGGRQPIRILDYRDDNDDLQNDSNAADHHNWNETGYTLGDLPDGQFIRVSAENLTSGAYPLYTQYSFVSLRRPDAAEYGLPLIKGDNSGNDARDVIDNIVSSAIGYGADARISEASPAKALLDSAYLLPQLMKVTKAVDGVNTSAANASYDDTLRTSFLASSYAALFSPADPATLTTGLDIVTVYGLGIGSVNLDANGQPIGYNAPVGGNIPIVTSNWFFGDFKRDTADSLLVRDLSDVFAAQRAQDLLYRSGLTLDWNQQAESNAKTMDQGNPALATDAAFLAMNADMAFNPTKGDLIVLGDYDSDGRFTGRDLYLLARGISLADNSSSTTLSGGAAAFADKVRSTDVVLRKNFALDWLAANATAQQKIEASANLVNDPAGANAFNKLDVNRDGLVDRRDAAIVDKFVGWDYRVFEDQLAATIGIDGTIDPAVAQRSISLVDVELNDTGDITLADFRLIRDDLLARGLLILGDANFDGSVNVGDLGILATNYGTTQAVGWSWGDFNLDGNVNVGDLGILATNYGTDALGPDLAEALAVFPNLDAGAVPEPAAGALVLVTGVGLVGRRRRSG